MADEQNVQPQNIQANDIQNQNAVVNTATVQAPVTQIQVDIAKIETAIEALINAGEELFTDEIAELEQKRDALMERAKAEMQVGATALEAAEQGIIAKYDSGTAHTVEIVMLIVILGKLFGII